MTTITRIDNKIIQREVQYAARNVTIMGGSSMSGTKVSGIEKIYGRVPKRLAHIAINEVTNEICHKVAAWQLWYGLFGTDAEGGKFVDTRHYLLQSTTPKCMEELVHNMLKDTINAHSEEETLHHFGWFAVRDTYVDLEAMEECLVNEFANSFAVDVQIKRLEAAIQAA